MDFVQNIRTIQLDVVALLAVLGEGSMLREAQVASFSIHSLIPRLLPAPQALLRHERPTRLPVKQGTIVGAYSGRVRHELNFLAQLLHPDDLDAYKVKLVKVTRKKEADRRDDKKPEDSYKPGTYGPSFWLSLVGLSLTIALVILSIVWEDGTALVATL